MPQSVAGPLDLSAGFSIEHPVGDERPDALGKGNASCDDVRVGFRLGADDSRLEEGDLGVFVVGLHDGARLGFRKRGLFPGEEDHGVIP